jgi:ferric-dicitrate binding protein FerR (iron transport regulator)
MNNPGQIQMDDEILAKYFSGEATPEEAMAVDNWVAASAANRALFDQAALIWEQTSATASWQLPDKQQLLRETKAQFKPASMKSFSWRIAAAVLVLIAAAGLYGWLHKRKAPVPVIWVTRQTGNGIFRDTLPDHSLVQLSSHSTIRYAAEPRDQARNIQLTGGASFDVTHDPAKPFIVSVGGIKVRVLGTSFLVQENSARVSVQVSSGAVRMYRGDSGITVKAGQEGLYDTGNRQFTLYPRGRSLNFVNASLKDIAAQLEDAYGIRVNFENKKLEACRMSSAFDNKSIQFIFEVISITLNVQYRIEKDTVYISGIGCN